MAMILGRKPLLETKDYEDYAIGLALPIQIATVAFKQNYTEIYIILYCNYFDSSFIHF